MINNEGMYQGYNVEGSAELKVKPDKTTMDNTTCMPQMCPPIYECPEENEICNVNACGPMFM